MTRYNAVQVSRFQTVSFGVTTPSARDGVMVSAASRADTLTPDTALRAETDAVQRAIATALDDCRIRLGPRAHTAFVDRLTELLDLDRERRHQARRDRAAAALFIDQATHERGRDD